MADLTDRALLMLAAKAAGYPVTEGTKDGRDILCLGGAEWDPRNDDGDEARLECALGLNVAWDFHSVRVGGATEFFRRRDGDDDKQAARRRAGVRAAAAIAGQPAQGGGA